MSPEINDVEDLHNDLQDMKAPDGPGFRELVLQEIKKRRRKNFFNNLLAVGKVTAKIILEKMNILKWLKNRLKEPTSYKAITIAGGLVGLSVSPELAEYIAGAVAGVLSLILFIEKEREDSPEN